MKKFIFTISVLVSGFVYSQVGINTEVPKATLDVTGMPSDISMADGIIAPRLKGSELKAKDALYAADQKSSLVYVTEPLAASDTTSKTINVTSIGYFYFDGNVWQKLNAGNVALEPWYNTATNQPADSNTQNIYQLGSVAIGKNSAASGAMLDVKGAIRGGNMPAGTIGENSIAVGDSLTASGKNASAFGWYNQATGLNAMTWGGNEGASVDSLSFNIASGVASTAFGIGTRSESFGTTTFGARNVASAPQATSFGSDNQSSGFWSTTFGRRNVASQNNSTAFGTDNVASGANSLAFGNGNTAASYVETVFGRYAAISTGTNGSWNANDPLLQIGNGASETSRSNALTILKNGNIGINESAPSTRLEVNNGTINGAIKIVDGTEAEGKILTSDANGVGTWQSTKVYAVKGDSGGYNIPFEEFSQYKYTGASITLPPGKWLVTVTQFTYISGTNAASVGVLAPSDAWMLVRATFSDETNLTAVGQNGSPSADITQPSTMSFTVQGPHREDSKTGVIYINNTSGGNKTYKYIAGQTQVSGTISSLFLNNFAGNWAENSIVAVAIN